MLTDEHGISPTGGISGFIVVIVFTLLFFSVFSFVIFRINGDYSKGRQLELTRALRKAVIAYSKQYSYDLQSLQNASEGYIVDEDFNKYSVKTNPINIDVPRSKKFFYRVLSGATPYSESELSRMNIYIGQVITEFSPTKKYTLTLYKQGDNPVINKRSYTSTIAMQQDIESLLQVDIDINTRLNNSIRKVQEYEKQIGTGKYSTYTTYMVLGLNIPVKSLFSNSNFNFYELQTYSLYR